MVISMLLKDCKALERYDAGKATALAREIQQFKEQTAKSNRKLAKDIATWVSTAMESSSSSGAKSRDDGKGAGRKQENEGESDGDDLGILEDNEDDDGGVEHKSGNLKMTSQVRSDKK